jgi:Skp family chaperone for outer membrane proteins
MAARLLPVLALALACAAAHAGEIVRCKVAGGGVTYQHGPCAGAAEESRPRIATDFPEPNKAESQRIFDREAALDRRLEARRDRELQEQQMREARAEREAERERQALLAAQQAPQYAIAYPLWRGYGYGAPRTTPHLPRRSPQAIFR